MLVKDIVKACNGVLLCGDPETVITSVETDSRLIEPGALFVPIIGQKTDAHQYIQQTFDKGAVATLSQEHTSMAVSYTHLIRCSAFYIYMKTKLLYLKISSFCSYQ